MDFKQIARDLREKLVSLILDQVSESIPGPDKMDAVVASAAKWLDDRLQFGKLGAVGMVLEMIDGPAIKAILSIAGQFVYDELKTAGKI